MCYIHLTCCWMFLKVLAPAFLTPAEVINLVFSKVSDILCSHSLLCVSSPLYTRLAAWLKLPTPPDIASLPSKSMRRNPNIQQLLTIRFSIFFQKHLPRGNFGLFLGWYMLQLCIFWLLSMSSAIILLYPPQLTQVTNMIWRGCVTAWGEA